MICKDCVTGSVHEGHTEGREETLFGLPLYVVDPPEGQEVKAIIVIIPDAFGWRFINLRLLADSYARKTSARVYIPDFMNGNGIAPEYMNTMDYAFKPAGSFMGALMKVPTFLTVARVMVPFLYLNRIAATRPRVFKFFNDLRASEEGMRLPVGVAGFCWGGLYTVLLCHGAEKVNGKTLVDFGYTAHPSNLTMPGDMEGVGLPLSIIIGDKDFVMPAPQVEQAQRILNKKDQSGKYEVTVIPGARHGFATRGDLKNEPEEQQAKQAEEQAVAFFSKWISKAGQ